MTGLLAAPLQWLGLAEPYGTVKPRTLGYLESRPSPMVSQPVEADVVLLRPRGDACITVVHVVVALAL